MRSHAGAPTVSFIASGSPSENTAAFGYFIAKLPNVPPNIAANVVNTRFVMMEPHIAVVDATSACGVPGWLSVDPSAIVTAPGRRPRGLRDVVIY